MSPSSPASRPTELTIAAVTTAPLRSSNPQRPAKASLRFGMIPLSSIDNTQLRKLVRRFQVFFAVDLFADGDGFRKGLNGPVDLAVLVTYHSQAVDAARHLERIDLPQSHLRQDRVLGQQLDFGVISPLGQNLGQGVRH
jgi:hypothetical protein